MAPWVRRVRAGRGVGEGGGGPRGASRTANTGACLHKDRGGSPGVKEEEEEEEGGETLTHLKPYLGKNN